jgi:hypothetical protein
MSKFVWFGLIKPSNETADRKSTMKLVVIGTDCIGSCKSNYHTITTMMPPYLDVILHLTKDLTKCQWPLSFAHVCASVCLFVHPSSICLPLKQVIWNLYTRSETLRGKHWPMSCILIFSLSKSLFMHLKWSWHRNTMSYKYYAILTLLSLSHWHR